MITGNVGFDDGEEWRRVTAGCLLAVSILPFFYLAAWFVRGPVDNWPLFICNSSLAVVSIAVALANRNLRVRSPKHRSPTRTELDAALRHRDRLATALSEKTATLESLNREMEDLLYVASHDLRTPLINVQGFSRELQLGLAELQRSNGRSPEVHAALADAADSLQFMLGALGRMDKLITSLLTVSRIASRTNPTEEVDLHAVVRRVTESFQIQLTENQIELEIESLPVVLGDSVRLGQLFGNLIDNAIRYMGDAPERRICIGAIEIDQQCRLFVRDTGPGIAPENHEQVFRFFRRLDTTESPGEGIGLTIVRKIAEKHGGRVWVESALGNGATFWIALPRPQPPHNAEAVPSGPPGEQAKPQPITGA